VTGCQKKDTEIFLQRENPVTENALSTNLLILQIISNGPNANLMHKYDRRQLAAVKKLHVNDVQLFQSEN